MVFRFSMLAILNGVCCYIVLDNWQVFFLLIRSFFGITVIQDQNGNGNVIIAENVTIFEKSFIGNGDIGI